MTGDGARITVNGRTAPITEVPGDERLLDTVRWRLGLKGTKEGCRTGECGACTVLIDGQTALSCLTLTREIEGRAVTTIEGIPDAPFGRAVLDAFAEAGAFQCGYCTPGFVVALAGLLREEGRSAPLRQLLEELGANLCRCTGYAAIARAVELARARGP